MHLKVTPRKLPKAMNQAKALEEFSKMKNQHFLLSALLDSANMLTDSFPVFGQFGNIILSLIYGLAIYFLFRRHRRLGVLVALGGAGLALLQEVDIVPMATIVWIYVYVLYKNRTLDSFLEEKRRNYDHLNNHHFGVQ